MSDLQGATGNLLAPGTSAVLNNFTNLIVGLIPSLPTCIILIQRIEGYWQCSGQSTGREGCSYAAK